MDASPADASLVADSVDEFSARALHAAHDVQNARSVKIVPEELVPDVQDVPDVHGSTISVGEEAAAGGDQWEGEQKSEADVEPLVRPPTDTLIDASASIDATEAASERGDAEKDADAGTSDGNVEKIAASAISSLEVDSAAGKNASAQANTDDAAGARVDSQAGTKADWDTNAAAHVSANAKVDAAAELAAVAKVYPATDASASAHADAKADVAANAMAATDVYADAGASDFTDVDIPADPAASTFS